MTAYLPSQPRKAIWNLILAYWVVTALGILLTIALGAIFSPPSAEELGVPFSQAPAYLMTLPYHPLINLLWIPFAWLYLRGWGAIPHPWAMTFKEFHVGYQPWITLVYLIIFAAPIIASRVKTSA